LLARVLHDVSIIDVCDVSLSARTLAQRFMFI